ncbi:MAG: ABC transporter ATP-binding protein [Candidatus Omnitrophica bacterium]|nr:ABC transporter ATP-binding protein [Candidatus Omnitrophota bacterium]
MLEAKNIHKVYSNGTKTLPVLKGVNLSIEQGKFIAIVGPSGAGKSTLLHVLGGLDHPSEGSVFFTGRDIYKLKDNARCALRNKNIGFVFQFYHLLAEFTVLENVALPKLIAQGNGPKAIIEDALKMLGKVGLSERLGHFPSQLSGGEKQRVAIARALINAPEILFCDEPTGNLDSASGGEIINLIRSINKENRMSVVLVTHNTELANSTDKVYHLKDGVLVN